MKRTDRDRIGNILRIWNELSREMTKRDITPELLLHDPFTQWAITTPLYNIGEQVYQLSAEFKQQYPDIPWSVVSGLRHRLVHNYEGINWTVIVEIVFHEMLEFIDQIQSISNGTNG